MTRDIALQHPATVLCISGLDPSGGAGLHADIEAIHACGAHALSALTVLTLQDTGNVHAVHPVDDDWFDRQIRHLADDVRIDAVKCGVLGSTGQVERAARWLDRLARPAVLDPVLHAGGGAELAGQPVAQALLTLLLPRVTVVTPNAAEARLLSGCDDLDDAARALGDRGATHVLVTGGDEAGDMVMDRHWHAGHIQRYTRGRLAGSFHGAGCTLASTIAALLAQGQAAKTAIPAAVERLAHWLSVPKAVGRGRPSPGRRP